MKQYLSAMLFCSAVMALPAQAANHEPIDFGAYNCQDFIQQVANNKAEDVGVVLTWIDGYLSGVTGDTVLDFDGMEKISVNLVKYCAAHGDAKLLDAARKVGVRSKD